MLRRLAHVVTDDEIKKLTSSIYIPAFFMALNSEAKMIQQKGTFFYWAKESWVTTPELRLYSKVMYLRSIINFLP